MDSSGNIVYLMRGLPATGKSHTAKKLAGEHGVICETDEFFLTQVGDDRRQFDYDESLMPTARAWNFARFERSVASGITPIVVDRGNDLSMETKRYIRYALDHGYQVEIKEPDSAWWQEIRVLLKYKSLTGPVLDQWAQELASYSRSIHRVPVETIRRRMEKWIHGLTVEDILNYRPKNGS
jgi:hypothetical protein